MVLVEKTRKQHFEKNNSGIFKANISYFNLHLEILLQCVYKYFNTVSSFWTGKQIIPITLNKIY